MALGYLQALLNPDEVEQVFLFDVLDLGEMLQDFFGNLMIRLWNGQDSVDFLLD